MFPNMYTNVHQCTPMYTSMHQCTLMYTNVHQCTPIYTNVHSVHACTADTRKNLYMKINARGNYILCPHY